jgi:Aminoglycoside-2''-adenylyltransferase
VSEAEQLAALARIHELLVEEGLEYWVFGGWAVDFHVGSVTREHDDIDIAVWARDRQRITQLLLAAGWTHAPDAGEDGYTGYERGSVRLELAFLARDEDGDVFTPLRDGRGDWPDGSFAGDLGEVRGVRARMVALEALRTDKRELRLDPVVAAKDRADSATLSRLPSQ